MNAALLRRMIAALGVAAGLGFAMLIRPAPYLVAPAATPFVQAERASQRAEPEAKASFRVQVARALEATRDAVARPAVQASTGQVLALAALLSLFAAGCVCVIALRLAALDRTQQAMVVHANDAGLNARRIETRARLADIGSIEAAAAQLAADTLAQPLRLREGYLVADALPTPFFSITDDAGDRYFFTTDPGLFRRLRIVRPSDRCCNVSALSVSARADMLAAWEALSALKGFSHIAVPRRADWHLIVYRPVREHEPVWRRLRTAWTAWRVARTASRRQPSSTAALRTAMPEERGA